MAAARRTSPSRRRPARTRDRIGPASENSRENFPTGDHYHYVVEHLIAWLAWALLISGLDDLFVDAMRVAASWRQRRRPAPVPVPGGERWTAIFCPLWHEHEVIASMLEHNLAALNYSKIHVFAGCYQNDAATIDAVEGVSRRFSNVHAARVPHDGPTSKADCLNWIYFSMIEFERASRIRFERVVVHDAEDLMHPESLRVLNAYSDSADMVQLPVLALPTPLRELVHGLYCDEFAEYQARDMVVRGFMRAFVPSAGVGAMYSRTAVELLAAESGWLFAPEALTEDYEIALRLKKLGCAQSAVPFLWHNGAPIATREYFPRKWRAALRQRTRWITGIALQCWQRHGWRGSWADRYWMWRDRKGLIGHPLSLAAGLAFVWALFHGLDGVSAAAQRVMGFTLCLALLRIAIRFRYVRRIYGLRFALGIPVRMAVGNLLSTLATVNAAVRFTWAVSRGEPLRWLKTQHAYPGQAALAAHKRRLGEVLCASGFVDAAALESALARPADGMRLGEYLVSQGALDQQRLYDALCLQHGLPHGPSSADAVSLAAAQILPAHVAATWGLLAFEVDGGRLHVAASDLPSDAVIAAIRPFTRLEIQFHLVPEQRLRDLRAVAAAP